MRTSRRIPVDQHTGSGCTTCITSRFAEYILYVKHIAIWMPTFFLTGFMYVRVIQALRTGAKRNARKRTLTIAFFALWFSWAVLTPPYAVFEFCAYFISNFTFLRDTLYGISQNMLFYQNLGSVFLT